jgi:hypothetical protein
MNFCDFKLMDLSLQAHFICRKGVYLTERSMDDLLVALYQVDDFYVEVYHRFSNSEIVKLISFHGGKLLEPYLEKIQLNVLLKDLFKAHQNATLR